MTGRLTRARTVDAAGSALRCGRPRRHGFRPLGDGGGRRPRSRRRSVLPRRRPARRFGPLGRPQNRSRSCCCRRSNAARISSNCCSRSAWVRLAHTVEHPGSAPHRPPALRTTRTCSRARPARRSPVQRRMSCTSRPRHPQMRPRAADHRSVRVSLSSWFGARRTSACPG